jgi:hypothetical protein
MSPLLIAVEREGWWWGLAQNRASIPFKAKRILRIVRCAVKTHGAKEVRAAFERGLKSWD